MDLARLLMVPFATLFVTLGDFCYGWVVCSCWEPLEGTVSGPFLLTRVSVTKTPMCKEACLNLIFFPSPFQTDVPLMTVETVLWRKGLQCSLPQLSPSLGNGWTVGKQEGKEYQVSEKSQLANFQSLLICNLGIDPLHGFDECVCSVV